MMSDGLVLVEQWDGWWVRDVASDQWIAGPHDSKEAARIASDHEVDRRTDSGLSIYRDEDGYWLREGNENVTGPFHTWHDANDVRENPPPPPPDEEVYHTSDRPSTVREQYEDAWRVKQGLR